MKTASRCSFHQRSYRAGTTFNKNEIPLLATRYCTNFHFRWIFTDHHHLRYLLRSAASSPRLTLGLSRAKSTRGQPKVWLIIFVTPSRLLHFNFSASRIRCGKNINLMLVALPKILRSIHKVIVLQSASFAAQH